MVLFCNDPTDANTCIICIYDYTCVGVCIVSISVLHIHSVVIVGSQFPVLCVYERLHSLWNTRTHSGNIKVQLVFFPRWCIKVKTQSEYISLSPESLKQWKSSHTPSEWFTINTALLSPVSYNHTVSTSCGCMPAMLHVATNRWMIYFVAF